MSFFFALLFFFCHGRKKEGIETVDRIDNRSRFGENMAKKEKKIGTIQWWRNDDDDDDEFINNGFNSMNVLNGEQECERETNGFGYEI